MNKTRGVIKVISQLVKELKPERGLIAFGLLALIAGSAINLYLPQVFRYLVTEEGLVYLKDNSLTVILFLTIILCLQAACFFFRSYFFSLTGHCFVKRMRDLAFKNLLNKPTSFYLEKQTADLISRLSGDLVIVQELINFKISIILRYSLQVAVAGLIMIFISYKLTLALLLIVPAIVITAIILGKQLKNLSSLFQSQVGSAMSLAQESLSNLPVIKVFQAAKFISQKFETITATAFKTGKTRSAFSAFFQSFINFLLNLSLVLMVFLGFYLVSIADLTLADLLTFIMYAGIVAVSFAFASSAYAEMSQASGSAERVFELLDTTVISVPAPQENAKHQLLDEINIEFSKINFSYPGNPKHLVLNNVSLKLLKGEPTAIVGISGSGKTSIVNLIFGLQTPNAGEIKINNQIATPELNNLLLANAALVPQEPLLFNFSIADNLRIGNPDASEPELWKVLEMVNLHNYVNSLPDKLEATCGERGTNLSLGQRQRLTLARAILKDPQLLILDEANSSLDSENEFIISQSLQKFFKERTVLIVTHRYSSLVNLQNILVLDQGTIVESGSHEQLIKANGLYKSLASLQGI